MPDVTIAAPTYRSHKEVRALEITDVSGFDVEVKNDVGQVERLALPSDMFSRYSPVAGDFLVIYRDGYMSFSPRSEFVDGYSAKEPGKPSDDATGRPMPGFTRDVFAGATDVRQTAAPTVAPEHSLFRKRYRKLGDEELVQHDHIKDRADALAQAIGALNPDVYRRLTEGGSTGFTMSKVYDGAGVTLALRHLEDAVYRAVKALTA